MSVEFNPSLFLSTLTKEIRNLQTNCNMLMLLKTQRGTLTGNETECEQIKEIALKISELAAQIIQLKENVIVSSSSNEKMVQTLEETKSFLGTRVKKLSSIKLDQPSLAPFAEFNERLEEDLKRLTTLLQEHLKRTEVLHGLFQELDEKKKDVLKSCDTVQAHLNENIEGLKEDVMSIGSNKRDKLSVLWEKSYNLGLLVDSFYESNRVAISNPMHTEMKRSKKEIDDLTSKLEVILDHYNIQDVNQIDWEKVLSIYPDHLTGDLKKYWEGLDESSQVSLSSYLWSTLSWGIKAVPYSLVSIALGRNVDAPPPVREGDVIQTSHDSVSTGVYGAMMGYSSLTQGVLQVKIGKEEISLGFNLNQEEKIPRDKLIQFFRYLTFCVALRFLKLDDCVSILEALKMKRVQNRSYMEVELLDERGKKDLEDLLEICSKWVV